VNGSDGGSSSSRMAAAAAALFQSKDPFFWKEHTIKTNRVQKRVDCIYNYYATNWIATHLYL